MAGVPPGHRGRGAGFDPPNPYAAWQREAVDDGWFDPELPPPPIASLTRDTSRSIISWNRSPDVPYDRSVNPYRGCEHGCIYCYARPSHAWLGLSPGLEFETQLFYKPAAADLLRRELARPGYRCAPLALSGDTDAYQPQERQLGLTRQLLEVLLAHRHPVLIVTKSALVERDLDLLQSLAAEDLVRVSLSLATLDPALARTLEPRAASPARRLGTIRALDQAGVPVGVLTAPVIPALTDAGLEAVLAAAREAGAAWAVYSLIRLPLEVEPLFRDWLQRHYPDRAERVLGLIRDSHGGRLYDPRFGLRMCGSGPVAGLIAQRFALAAKRLGFGPAGAPDSSRFRLPGMGEQLSLW
jgi:DNA repair photolyase